MQVTKFLLYIIYITLVFFLPNSWWVWIPVGINIILMIYVVAKSQSWLVLAKILRKTFGILPFIIFTAIFNWWLDSWQAALWVSLKLLIVCNATMIYSANMTVTEVSEVIAKICVPLKYIGIRPDEIKILVSVALMMIPVFKKELREVQQACRVKGMKWNLQTAKMVLQKTSWSLILRVNQIEEGLTAKGYEIE